MGYLCEFCGERSSVVYCRSDMASLCLSCDHNVHSANALSSRHSRTLICGRCNTQPALLRCVDESMSLCQSCDCMGQTGSDETSAHRREAIRCYSGCPSVSEPSAMLSFLLDFRFDGNSACNHGMGTKGVKTNDAQRSQGKDKPENSSFWVESSTSHDDMDGAILWLENVDSLASSNPITAKALISEEKEPNGFCDDFNMDEIDLSIENYDGLFNDDDIDGLFDPKYMPEFSCQDVTLAEVSSDGGMWLQPECSKAASADSAISCCKTEPNLLLARQHSSISFLTGETNNGGDHQDTGVSPMLPPWLPPAHENSMASSTRTDAVMRYKEKKKARKYEKKVRYASRKAMADVRRRVKGRFVKAGDAYDFDPSEETREQLS